MSQESSPVSLEKEKNPVTAENLLVSFHKARIPVDREIFQSLYSNFLEDNERVQNLRDLYQAEPNKDKEGSLGEALVYKVIRDGALGSQISTRGTSLYDDYFKGADLVIEGVNRQVRDPIVASVDVTISQQALGELKNEGVFEEIGFEKKLERVKRHIDDLAKLSPRDAIEISAWLQSGGLSQPKTKTNEKMFKEAEKLMLLKYYTNPSTSEDPHRPHFVLAGPQVIVSIDRSFINKVFHGNNQTRALRDISLLVQTQVPFSVLMLKQYIEKLKKENRGNVFLDATLVACRSWELTFDNEIYQVKLENALRECSRDPQLRQQVQYYQQTVARALK